MSQSKSQYLPLHPFLLTKLTEASKSQEIDSRFITKTKTKTETFQNLNMPPPCMFLFDQIVANLNNLNFLICIQVNKSNQNLQTYKNELQNLSKKVTLNKNSNFPMTHKGCGTHQAKRGTQKRFIFIDSGSVSLFIAFSISP